MMAKVSKRMKEISAKINAEKNIQYQKLLIF